jgi:hypothetical protein
LQSLASLTLNPGLSGVVWWLDGLYYPKYLEYEKVFPSWLKWSENLLSYMPRFDGVNIPSIGYKSKGCL